MTVAKGDRVKNGDTVIALPADATDGDAVGNEGHASPAGRRSQRTARRRLRRGAYLLPSLFTIGNMLLGFYAVVTAFRGSRLLVTEAADALLRARRPGGLHRRHPRHASTAGSPA